MSQDNQGIVDADERERSELLARIGEVNAKIQQKVAALMAHPNVPQVFKDELEKISGEVK